VPQSPQKLASGGFSEPHFVQHAFSAAPQRMRNFLPAAFSKSQLAQRTLKELAERMRKFRLELHPEKTRLTEFGPFAAKNRKRRGEEKPETFDFLGFTHIWRLGVIT
jgi:hypothetical protein